jgi:hypothetical protein
MLMLQMQAEAWRMQWSVAMQENEELRAKLYNTRNSLEAAGGGGASGEHWRELCISIAKSAEDEKGQIVYQINSMREELGINGSTAAERSELLDALMLAAEQDRKVPPTAPTAHRSFERKPLPRQRDVPLLRRMFDLWVPGGGGVVGQGQRHHPAAQRAERAAVRRREQGRRDGGRFGTGGTEQWGPDQPHLRRAVGPRSPPLAHPHSRSTPPPMIRDATPLMTPPSAPMGPQDAPR